MIHPFFDSTTTMSNALRDQLLKAGLVNEKQVKKAQQEKRKENRQVQNKPATVDARRAERETATLAKAERDRELNRERHEEQERKAGRAQIRQLLEAHRLTPEAGEIRFNFIDDGKVKSLYVSEATRLRLTRGRWGIIRVEGHYEMVEAEIAEKMAERDASVVILLNRREENAPAKATDDPYAAYVIPDDLIW